MTKKKPNARRGRPRIDERRWQITLRMPRAAGQSVEARAKLAGVPVTAWLRQVVLRELQTAK